MTSIFTILLTILICGIVSIALFCACLGILWIIAIGGAFGGTTLGFWELPITIICVIGCFASLLVCPFGAYYIRQTILDFADGFFLRFLVFCLVAGFQVTTITSVYFSGQVYGSILEARRSKRLESHRELLRQLEEANVSATVNRARILGDDGENITAEVTLQIENVPLVLPYYEIYISRINNLSGEFFVEPYIAYSKLPKPWIKATSLNKKWTFEEIETSRLLSDNPDEVTFRIEFARRYTNPTALPTSITPAFLIRWKDYNADLGDPNINITDSTFFDREITIHFEKE